MTVAVTDTEGATTNYTISAGADGGTTGTDFAAGTYDVTDTDGNIVGSATFVAADLTEIAGGTLTDYEISFEANTVFQTGANEGDTLAITIGDMSAKGLGVDGIDISTREAASTAITTVNDAINSVSTQRANLGAVQNRLEHKIANLDASAENLQAAESRIRDVDMAKEMMEYTKNNILSQAANAMLAQANQAPQNVLQLLR